MVLVAMVFNFFLSCGFGGCGGGDGGCGGALVAMGLVAVVVMMMVW